MADKAAAGRKEKKRWVFAEACAVQPIIQELAVSLRSLRRSPGFASVAISTLALGIAGTTAVFSVINAALLEPLPYGDSRRLFIARWQNQPNISASVFFLVKDRVHSFSNVAALYDVDLGVNVSTDRHPQYVRALSVSQDFFPTLGVQPELGQIFSPEQDQPNAPPAVVLSDALWTQNFGRDLSVIGHNLRVDDRFFRIVGVMPREFRSYPDADIWLPLQLRPGAADPNNNYTIIGRLRDGISQGQAQSELDAVASEYHLTYPWSAPLGKIFIQPLQSFLTRKERPALAVLFATVVFVFLIACSNVAVLILVRGAASTQTIAVRAALGPPRGRLLLSLLSESMLLSLAAGVLGLIAAKESLPLLRWLWPANLPLSTPLQISGSVAMFALAVTAFSPLAFGLVPAFKLSRVDIAQLLARSSRTASASEDQTRMIRLLVFGQMALTVMLLAGTMLLVKSLLNLYSVDLGFETANLVVAQISPSAERYRATAPMSQLVDQTIQYLQAMPGVDAAAAVVGLPLDGGFNVPNGINVPIRPLESPLTIDHANEYRPITLDYFKTLHIPLRSGRLFLETDRAGAAPVAIVNETMARRWWPNSSAIGHFVKVAEEAGPEAADSSRQIVGIVGDIKEKELGEAAPPTVFIPLSQTPDNLTAFFNKTFLVSIVVRTSTRTDFANQLRSAVQAADPGLPLASYRPFRQILDQSLANQRFTAFLTTAFGALALFLTVVGMQGLLNYQARLRSREVAVRMTVGASRRHIVFMVVQRGAKLISSALLAGLAGSLVVVRLLGSLLYNVQRTSLIVVLATAALLGLVAALMSVLTAVRAASIEPMTILRNE